MTTRTSDCGSAKLPLSQDVTSHSNVTSNTRNKAPTNLNEGDLLNPPNSRMSAAGGLSRRRGQGVASSSSYNDDNDLHASNGHSQTGSRSGSPPRTQHAGSAFEGGSKIAFDPRDVTQDASEEARIGGKMPRLTIMEEVLLLGIKDKQVCRCKNIKIFLVAL